MKWIENKRCTHSRFLLKEYPFFNAYFEGNKYAGYELGYMFPYPRKRFKDIEEAKNYIIEHIYRHLIKIKEVETLDQFRNNSVVRIAYDTWCGNIGEGKYCDKNLYLKYHWLEGRPLHTSGISNNYAIRFERTLGEEDVKRIGVKLLKRHINKFLREYSALVETKKI